MAQGTLQQKLLQRRRGKGKGKCEGQHERVGERRERYIQQSLQSARFLALGAAAAHAARVAGRASAILLLQVLARPLYPPAAECSGERRAGVAHRRASAIHTVKAPPAEPIGSGNGEREREENRKLPFFGRQSTERRRWREWASEPAAASLLCLLVFSPDLARPIMPPARPSPPPEGSLSRASEL